MWIRFFWKQIAHPLGSRFIEFLKKHEETIDFYWTPIGIFCIMTLRLYQMSISSSDFSYTGVVKDDLSKKLPSMKAQSETSSSPADKAVVVSCTPLRYKHFKEQQCLKKTHQDDLLLSHKLQDPLSPSSALKVDLNTADVQQLLCFIPGLSFKIAQDIVDFREKNGPYTSVHDLLQIRGIGPKRLEKYAPFLEIGAV